MKSALFTASNVFTAIIGLILIGAFLEALTYPLRASILILCVCAVGVMLVALELFNATRKNMRAEAGGQDEEEAEVEGVGNDEGMLYDTPMFADTREAKDRRMGMFDIWAWYVGLLVAVLFIGFHVAIPLFAILYGRTHGGTWLSSIVMAGVLLATIVVVFTWMMGTPWPTPYVFEWFGVDRIF